MATLEKIRSKAGVLVAVVIGLALLAFILGDFINSGSSLFRNSQLEIAHVAGNSIPVQTYQERLEKSIENRKRNTRQSNLDEATIDQIQEQTWDDLIRENVMKGEFEALGLDVSSDELFDMVQGKNVHPSIMQVPIFQDQTGQFNPVLVIQFLKNLDQDQTGNLRESWLEFEQSILRERLNSKYNTLLKKGLYVTRDKAVEEAKYRATKVEFEYVGARLNTVPDSLIVITDEDIQKYYDENIEDFKQKASREIEYVSFDILPSEEDDVLSKKWVEDIKNEFINAESDKQFVNLNGDTGFNTVYFKQGELSAELDEFAFNAKVGEVYGTYKEDDAYKLAKLSSIEYLPDSVRASHILIGPDENDNDISAAKYMVDSLQQLVLDGASFEVLATKYGSDGTAAKGGDLGWFQPADMVQAFSDTCFFSEKGHVTTVITQHGAHLVKVTGRSKEVKKVQLAILDRIIIPSNKTIQFIYQQASEFAGKNNSLEKFDNAVVEQGLNKRLSQALRINDKKISGLESPRELVRWAFNSEPEAVSPVFELGDKFVVAVITEVNEEGHVPLEQIRTQIENEVRKEKVREYLYEKVLNAFLANSNIEDLAKELDTEIKISKNVTFTAFSISGLGTEHEVQAHAIKLGIGEQSGVIKGKNGVYVIRVTDIIESEPLATNEEQKKLISSQASKVEYQIFETLKAIADIEDKRYKFY